MNKPTREQKSIWLNEFYEWYKDCFSIDGDMAEQVKTQMFADMKYAYIAAKKSDFEEIKTLKEQLAKAEQLIEEKMVIDDCGFDPSCETKFELENIMLINDCVVRQYFAEK